MRPIIRERILKKYNYKCVNCNATEKLEIDHIIPVSRGGREDEDNMQVLCKKCNLKKGGGINFNKYFKKGDGDKFIYISTELPLTSLKRNELILLLKNKFKELCQ